MKEKDREERGMNESEETRNKQIGKKEEWMKVKKQETSKFHREFMSPALFLFELLKMGVNQTTIGPVSLT